MLLQPISSAELLLSLVTEKTGAATLTRIVVLAGRSVAWINVTSRRRILHGAWSCQRANTRRE